MYDHCHHDTDYGLFVGALWNCERSLRTRNYGDKRCGISCGSNFKCQVFKRHALNTSFIVHSVQQWWKWTAGVNSNTKTAVFFWMQQNSTYWCQCLTSQSSASLRVHLLIPHCCLTISSHPRVKPQLLFEYFRLYSIIPIIFLPSNFVNCIRF